MEPQGWDSQIDQVISQLGELLQNGVPLPGSNSSSSNSSSSHSNVSHGGRRTNSYHQSHQQQLQLAQQQSQKPVMSEEQMRAQMKLMAKKQKNIHMLCVKEQMQIDEITFEIQAIKNAPLQKDLQESVNELRMEVEYNAKQIDENERILASTRAEVNSAKTQLTSRVEKMREFEVEFKSAGEELAELNSKCSENLSTWERINAENINLKSVNARMAEELEAKEKATQLAAVEMEELKAQIQQRIEENREKARSLAQVNKQLENRLAEVAEEPQKLKKALKACSAMLAEKKALLQQQEIKLAKNQRIS